MGYKAKDRIGDRSGDLEIIKRIGRTESREIVWLARCRRVRADNTVCKNTIEIPTHRIGYAMCCKPCSYVGRKGKKGYEWTSEMDRMIGRIALERAGKRNSDLPSYAQYAVKLGRPKHVVTARARTLGLARPREPRWSETELAILKRLAWATPHKIHAHLKAKGFTRSLTAVALQRKRMRLYSGREWLNARELAEALGLDSHAVASWVKDGFLKAKIRELQANGNGHSREKEYVFMLKEVRKFILAHNELIDLRKVNQAWFFDIIKFGASAT